MLNINDLAPDFTLQGSDLKEHSLQEFRGKKVVLYFYPKDNTSGCSKEAVMFNELKEQFEKENAVIIGVSKDSLASHKKFIDNYALSFLLLSDPEQEVIKAYDVLREKSMYGRKYLGVLRSTFVISEEGKILLADYGCKATESPKTVCRLLLK